MMNITSMSARRARLVGSMAMAFVVAGCDGAGDDLPREPVSGTVTLDGQPLERGLIRFTPADAAASRPPTEEEAVAGSGLIANGEFSIDRSRGLTPGKYKVMITAPSASTSTSPDPKAPAKERIPTSYNMATTLTEEVKAGDSNDFEYKLSSDAPSPDVSKNAAKGGRRRRP